MAELIDLVLNRLKSHQMTMQEIADRIGIPRVAIYTQRRSMKAAKRDQLAQKIIEAFPEYFEEEKLVEELKITSEPTQELQEKYTQQLQKTIEILEKTLEECRADKAKIEKDLDKLRKEIHQENDNVIAEIRKLLNETKTL